MSIQATSEASELEVELMTKLPSLRVTERNPGLLVFSVDRKTRLDVLAQSLVTVAVPPESVTEPWREMTAVD